MSTVTPIEHTAIGALAGLTEVCLMQPTVAIKNALQEGRPLPGSLSQYYRGLVINAGAMLPIVATQFGVNRLLEQKYTAIKGHPPGEMASIGVALGAGSASAFFGCAAEFVMIQQQKTGRSLPNEIKHIYSAYGPLKVLKGLNVTVARESLYAAGYLGVLPILRRHLQDVPGIKDTPGAPLIISGVTAGLLATVTTQPLDTIKTRMQAFPDSLEHPQYKSLGSTTRYIIQNEGASALFSGLIPRAGRIVAAVFILTGTRNTLVDALDKSRTQATNEASLHAL